MLVIRMQRTGRKGHAMFRVIVQDSRLTPTSGKVVAYVGSYDPHAKTSTLDKDKAAFYLEHGAQPSDRVARLLQAEGVKLPDWVGLSSAKERTVRNPDKRRSTRPAEEAVAEPAAGEAGEPAVTPQEAPADTPAIKAADAADEVPVEEATAPEDSAETDSVEEPKA